MPPPVVRVPKYIGRGAFLDVPAYAGNASMALVVNGAGTGYQYVAVALAAHVHAGEDIASGTVADARIASTITRDNEVMTIVLASDGSGSGLDADLLRGVTPSAYILTLADDADAPTARNTLGLGSMAVEVAANYLLATGATTGATSRAQTFTNGVIVGAEKAVTIASQDTPFTLHVASNVFNGTRDDVCYWAYNLQPGSTTARVDTGKPQLKFAMEADYNVDGTKHLIEYNFDYMSANAAVNKRPISWNTNLSSQVSELSLAAGTINLLSENNAQTYLIATAPATNTNKIAMFAGSSQSGNLFEWRSYSDTLMAAIQSDGGLLSDKLTAPSGVLTATDTFLRFVKSGAATNEKTWQLEFSNTQLAIKAYNDTVSSAGTVMTATRSASAISSVNFPVANFTLSGSNPNVVSGASSALGVGGSSFQLRSASPAFVYENTSAAANTKIWTAFETGATTLTGRVLNDALSASANWIVVTRSTSSVSSVSFPNGNLLLAGNIRPTADGTSAINFQSNGGSLVARIDTANLRFGIGNTPTAQLDVPASTSNHASLRIRNGAFPTGANRNDGDIGYVTSGRLTMYRGSTEEIFATGVQATGGIATAGGTYGVTEQTMLQAVYNAARTFGLLS